MEDILIEILRAVFRALLGWLIVSATIKVYEVVKTEVVKNAVKKTYKNAFQALITSKDTKTVQVGIWDATKEIGEMEIKSDKGISDEIQTGQVIYI